MFKKVLIAEDHEIANISVQKTLHQLGIQNTKYVYYCDHALSWIKNAIKEGDPYELLITDLVFEDDQTEQHITDGLELVKAAKAIQPDLKVIVLSAENRKAIITKLITEQAIDAFVRKARRDAQHLQEALLAVSQNKTYQSPEAVETIREKNSHEFLSVDLHIIKLLHAGISQKEMPVFLQERNIKPSSLSSIEKRLNLMKEVLGFSKNEQLVSYCKDMGLI